MDFKTSIISGLLALQAPYAEGSVTWVQVQKMREMVERETNATKLAHMLKIMQEILGREITTMAPEEETTDVPS